MAGAFLLGLFNEPDAGSRKQLADLSALMAHDDGNVHWRGDGAGSLNNVFDQRKSAGAVQDLGALGFHASPEASGQNDHVDLQFHSVRLTLSEDPDLSAPRSSPLCQL